jgi:hypothetical protein
MEGFAVVLATVGLLAAAVTKATDLVRNLVDKRDKLPKWTWNVVPFGIGIAYAVGWHHNVTQDLAALVPALADKGVLLVGVAGEIVTGLVIGGAAGGLHEVFDALSSIANRNNGTVPVPPPEE